MSDDNKIIPIHQYLDRVADRYDEQSDLMAADEKAYDFSRDGDPTAANALWDEEFKAWADMQTLESLFYSEDWVYILVDLFANKISSRPLYVMQRKMDQGVESIDYADGHPLNALIENPNPLQDYHSWMYNTAVQFGLLGNAVEWYSKANNWLTTLRTSLISINFDDVGAIKNYMYALSDEENKSKAVQLYAPDEIIHIRRPNPASMIWGLSPFIPGRKSILFNRYSTDYLNAFYLKQATPGMIIEMDREVNEPQALRQLRSIELAYTGRKNQRRTMLLPKGMKATIAAHTIADQKIIDLVNQNRETIMNLLRVPKHELGLQTAGSLGSEEYKIALRNFWESTLIPAMRLIEGGLTKFFKPQLGKDFFFQFDLDDVEALKDDQMKKATLAKEMLAGGLSVNEVRVSVWDQEAAPGSENDAPFVTKPTAPAFGPPPTTESAPIADVPPVEEPPIKTDPIQDLESGKVIDSTGTDKLRAFIGKRNAGWADRYIKAVEELTDKKQGRKLYGIAMETLVTMAEIAVPIIKRNLVETKSDLPSKTKLKKELLNAFDNLEAEYKSAYVSTLESVVELGYDMQLDFVFNKTDLEKIAVLRARGEKGRRAILEERGLESFANVSKTHTDRIMAEIVNGVAKNETIQQIIGRVAEALGDKKNLAGKAETIARTETLTAMSVGNYASFKNAVEVIPGIKKGWLNADDSRVRDQHLDEKDGGVSGEVIGANEAFSNGLRYPRDTASDDPSQVINCRCTLITLLPGEEL